MSKPREMPVPLVEWEIAPAVADNEPALAVVQDLLPLCKIEDEQGIVHRAFQSTTQGVMISDVRNRILFVNEGFRRVTGYSLTEVRGLSPSLLGSGLHDGAFYKAMWDSLSAKGTWQGQIWNRRKSGDIYPEWLDITAVRGDRGQTEYYVAIFSDLSAQNEMKRNLRQLAFYDSVTGLPNRQTCLIRLTQSIAQASQVHQRVGLIFLDLDRFSLINDTLGHNAGDRLLKQVGQRLSEILRESDTVARLGGDEFILLLPGLGNQTSTSVLVQKVLQTFKQPFQLDSGVYYLSASIGVSHYPEDGKEPGVLLQNAESAMYRAKEQAGNSYFFYQDGIEHKAAHRLELESALREALEREQFTLHFQPQVETRTGRIRGVEALVRWQHPERGMVSPGEFLPLAEETGLIRPLGSWVLRHACRTLREWQEQGIGGISVAVNLSPHQFLDRGLTDEIARTLEEFGLAPDDLELEITESAAMPNLEYSIRMLKELRELGLRVAIDDFGTGFSSLAQLKRLPITGLKVDQSFVRDIPENEDDCAIASTIIRLAQRLRLEVVAEGVERPEQLAMLEGEGCTLVQGYLFSRPLPPDKLLPMLLGPAFPFRPAATGAVEVAI